MRARHVLDLAAQREAAGELGRAEHDATAAGEGQEDSLTGLRAAEAGSSRSASGGARAGRAGLVGVLLTSFLHILPRISSVFRPSRMRSIHGCWIIRMLAPSGTSPGTTGVGAGAGGMFSSGTNFEPDGLGMATTAPSLAGAAVGTV